MKTRTHLLVLCSLLYFIPSTAQESKKELPKVVNHLTGELDYSQGALDLVQKLPNSTELSLGKISTDGTIHFNLPQYDIKALYESINSQPVNFPQWFSIDSSCKDRDVFAKTAVDDVYAQQTKAIWIKKYGIYASILETDETKETLQNKSGTKDSIGSIKNYFWFYIDRDIAYKESCSKVSHITGNIDHTITVDIDFKKGWNFIEENKAYTLDDEQSDMNVSQVRKTHFSKKSPTDKNVKWKLRQVANVDKLKMAKSLYHLSPLTKAQFEKWAPKKLKDLTATTKEHGNPPEGQENKNNMHLIYSNKAKDKVIDLYVIDAAKSPDDMEMINFAFAMENDGKDEKDIKPYVTQFNERIKATQLFYKVEDRIIVNASGTNMDGEALWGYIQKLNVEKLLKK